MAYRSIVLCSRLGAHNCRMNALLRSDVTTPLEEVALPDSKLALRPYAAVVPDTTMLTASHGSKLSPVILPVG